ncbi:hypothetical protein [Nocardioides aquiterrae]|uniref:Uncharacterized protein n=1 Tax=Nocardioides aquiterrae TaxID=203799 RepID=A0ABP4EYA7_9ACTN
MGIGFGLGVGPFRVGTSARSRDIQGCAPILGIFLILGLVLLAIFWPFLLGQWIAEKLGAPPNGSSAHALGWIFEAIYVAVLVLGYVALRRHSALVAKEREATERRETLRRSLVELDALATAIREQRWPLEYADVWLIEPRVRVTHGPQVPTAIEQGTVRIHPSGVEFIGATKRVEWRADRIREVIHDGYFAFHLTSRKTVSGLSADGSEALGYAIDFVWKGRESRAASDVCLSRIAHARLRVDAELRAADAITNSR